LKYLDSNIIDLSFNFFILFLS